MSRLQQTILTLICIVFILAPPTSAKERGDKFLIIHADAISAEDFFAELEAGYLPNIAYLFQDGQQVRHGLTLYPGGTEIIMPRIKAGLDNSQGNSVGWGYLDRDQDKEVGLMPVFLEMFAEFPRRSRHHFAIGLPPLHHLAGLSLLNLDRIWETQDVAEFYWFHSDVAGHMFGREEHLKSLRTLDHYLGLVAKSGRLEGANIVLYADHGMVTQGVEVFKYRELVSEVVQDALRFVDYPNIYLNDSSQREELAKRMVAETAIDLALVKVSSDRMRGYTAQGSFDVVHQDGKYAYSFTGVDYFGYEKLGCADVFLSKEEWLRQTKEHRYVAIPPNFYNYLSNPQVGDIVAILDSPKILHALTAMKGNHSGVTSTDLVVPLLLTGPAFEELKPIQEFWLHELYSVHLPMIDVSAKEQRERHRLSLGYPAHLELSLSPAARWRGGVGVTESAISPWLEYDLYSSFLSRMWLGVNWSQHGLGWQMRMEAFLGDFSLSWLKRQRDEGELCFHWRFTEQAELTVAKARAGVSIIF